MLRPIQQITCPLGLNTTENIEDSSMTPRSSNNAEHVVLSSDKSSVNNSIPLINKKINDDTVMYRNKEQFSDTV